MRKFKFVLAIGAGMLAAMLVASTATAVLIYRSGTFSEQQRFASETNAFATSSTGYVNVPGMVRAVSIPSGTRRMFDARYTAESSCTGRSGWCTVRLIVIHPSGAQQEMEPASGLDFAFDTVSPNDLWEAHSIERTSPYFPAGVYRVQVQTRIVGGPATVRLDEQHLAVEVIRP